MSYPAPVTTRPDHPRLTPAVQALLVVHLAVAFVAATVWRTEDMARALAFQWDAGQPFRWWSIVSYMFVHAGVWPLLANLYGLFLFGPRLEHSWGTKRFVRFYLLAGLGGLAAHVLFVRGDALLVGSSAAVFGVMGAYAMQWPREEIQLFGIVPVRVWSVVVMLATFSLILGVFGGVDATPQPAYLAHLGGFAMAWFYMRTPPSMSIEQLRQRVSQVPDTDDSPPRAIPRNPPRQRERMDEVDEIVAKSKAMVAKRPAVAARAAKRDSGAERRAALDRVLDKISAHGIESLTSEEKLVLEEMSRRLRDS